MSSGRLLCIAGGGTGGHVIPALALADEIRRCLPHVRATFIGAERGIEASLLPERGEQVLLLRMHGVKGAGILRKLRVLTWELPRAVLRILRQWRSARPDLVVGVGGYASVAGVAAALLKRTPVVLYEQNAMPGLVNRWLAPLCDRILLGFAEAAARLPGHKCTHAGNLVPRRVRSVTWQPHKPPMLIVTGGSQGAAFLNETVPQACGLLRKKGLDFRITHVAGNRQGDREAVAAQYAEAGVSARVLDFCDDMPGLYAGGDLMIARSGAMTVSEAAVVGMPSIFVPFPYAADQHQHHNARVLEARDAAIVIDQSRTDAAALAGHIENLLLNPERLSAMSSAAIRAVPADSGERMLNALQPWLGSAE